MKKTYLKVLVLALIIFVFGISGLWGQYGGGTGSSSDPYKISTVEHLADLATAVNGGTHYDGVYFEQQDDIDLNVDPYNTGEGWTPIGTFVSASDNKPFRGIYNGNNKKILNLYINRLGAGEPTDATTANALPGNQGLFGYVEGGTTSDAVIKNLGISGANVTGGRGTGALIGRILLPSNAAYTVITEQCWVGGTSNIIGYGATGGLVGANNSARSNRVPVIRYCFSNATVESRWPTNSVLTGEAGSEPYNIKYGGLVGCNENGMTTDSYATGNVRGYHRVGGLAGCTIRGAILRSFATGAARHGNDAYDSPFTYTANASPWVGGLVGRVEGKLPPGLGGFTGSGSVQVSYFNTDANSSSASGTGLTQIELQNSANLVGFDFTGVWYDVNPDTGYPVLNWETEVNFSPIANTYEGNLFPTLSEGEALTNALYSATQIGGHNVEAAFMPKADETVRISVFVTYSTNPAVLTGFSPTAAQNLGAYYKFWASNFAIFRAGQYVDVQFPNEPNALWYRYSETSDWSVIPSSNYTGPNAPNYTYRITLAGLIDAKSEGDLEIAGDKGGDSTLPVELSSFTAMVLGSGRVRLDWVTQSETNVNGYYLWRSPTDNLYHAEIVSPLVGATNTSNTMVYSFEDREISSDGVYRYWLQNVDFDGTTDYHGPITVTISFANTTAPQIPMQTELSGVYPNPFNPELRIGYALKAATEVKIDVLNIRGQVLRNLKSGSADAGRYTLIWDGKDNLGNPCAAGIFFIRMTTDRETFTRKAVMMK